VILKIKRAVFLDRDGTINKEVGYLTSPEQVRLINGSVEAIKLLAENNFKIIIVTNQAGVAKGYIKEEVVEAIHNRLRELLEARGAKIDAIYFCPHHPDGVIERFKRECPNRKPNPGMLLKAAHEHSINLESSYMVGDMARDIISGVRAGVRTVMVLTGNGRQELEKLPIDIKPDYVAKNLLEAARWIVNNLTKEH
jgi:D-glycero-D-manno-heptose 1,7-bisphosphate phosphatase